MGALIVTVFVASLLGSLHCAGMCGAFVAFAVGAAPGPGPQRWRLIAWYNLGRLLTYTLLGAVFGALGSALNFGGAMLGVSHAAAALAGAIMIGFGVLMILRYYGVRAGLQTSPRWLQRAIGAGQMAAMELSPTARALSIGLLTTLLPCGWLYAFAITAGGTGSPLRGAMTMAAFWAGTLPVVAALGMGIQRLAAAVGARLPILVSVAIVGVGLYTLAGRVAVDPTALAADPIVTDAPELPSIKRTECPVCDQH
jgi:sulfite exporter TauE/SafE